MKEEEFDSNWLADYGHLILCPLESLFDGAGEDFYGISLPGKIVLTTIKENIQALFEMLEKEFGAIDVLYNHGDPLRRPAKISAQEAEIKCRCSPN